MARLNNQDYAFQPRSGLFANINTTANRNSAVDGEIVYTTDTKQLFVYNGSEFEPITKFNQFIYNSSGVQSGNRFNNWSDLMTARATVAGEVRIYFEQNETLPAGAYDLRQTVLYGDGVNMGVTLTIPTGVTFTDWQYGGISGGLHIQSTSGTYVYSFDVGQTLLLNQGFISCTTAPFFYSEGTFDFTQIVAVSMDNGSEIFGLGDAGSEVIELNGSALIFAYQGASAYAHDDTIKGTGFHIKAVIDAATPLPLPTHTNFTPLADETGLNVESALIKYNNATSGLTATNVNAAIDELKALIDGL